MGYAAAQLGTRFIATRECHAHPNYKAAIIEADESDIVLTERLTGVPVAVIDTPYIRRIGTRSGWLARRLLRGGRTKHFMRTVYALRSLWQLKRGLDRGDESADYWQAGKSVASIDDVLPAGEIVARFAESARASAAAEGPFPVARAVPG
jgi:nitronate monooxygenase